MSTQPFIYIAIGLGFTINIIYIVIQSSRWGFKPESCDLESIITFFLASAGMLAGIKVCMLAVDKNLCEPLKPDRLYIFVGGFAVILCSIFAVVRGFRESTQKRKTPASSD